MYTLKDVKEKYIAYLMSIDLDNLDMMSLHTYGSIIKNIDEMEKPGYAETLSLAFANLNAANMKKEEKEETKNA